MNNHHDKGDFLDGETSFSIDEHSILEITLTEQEVDLNDCEPRVSKPQNSVPMASVDNSSLHQPHPPYRNHSLCSGIAKNQNGLLRKDTPNRQGRLKSDDASVLSFHTAGLHKMSNHQRRFSIDCRSNYEYEDDAVVTIYNQEASKYRKGVDDAHSGHVDEEMPFVPSQKEDKELSSTSKTADEIFSGSFGSLPDMNNINDSIVPVSKIKKVDLYRFKAIWKKLLRHKTIKAIQLLLVMYIAIMTFGPGGLRDSETGLVQDPDEERNERGVILVNGTERAVIANNVFQVALIGVARLSAWFMYPRKFPFLRMALRTTTH